MCFLAVVLIPWRTETILPAEISLQPYSVNIPYTAEAHPLQEYTSHSISANQHMLVHPLAKEVVMEMSQDGSSSYSALTPQEVELQANASKNDGIEISKGQDAIFFPENEKINPMYIALTEVSFNENGSHIKGKPLKINQYLDGKIKGIVAIKGERKSILMRVYHSFFH